MEKRETTDINKVKNAAGRQESSVIGSKSYSPRKWPKNPHIKS